MYIKILQTFHIFIRYNYLSVEKKTNSETCSFPLPVDSNQFNNKETTKTQIIIYRHTHPKPQSRFYELRPLVLLTEFQPSLRLVRMYY